MLRVGLTGGLASGKSFVAQALHDLGCHLIQADELGHQVMQKGAEAYQPILSVFGPQILTPNEEIDRRKLGKQVFENPEQLKKLSAIVHPAVRARGRQLEASFKLQDPHGIIVYEAAILVETGSFRDYERLI